MAFQNPLDRKPGAAHGTVQLDGLARVAGARRIKPALTSEEGREQQPVAVDQYEQNRFHP